MKHLLLIIIMTVSAVARADEGLSLDNYLKEVEGKNLTLKASDASVDAANARSAGISLPEPMVGLTQMRDESGRANGFEVSQTIPFPTKLSNDRNARKLEAAAEKVNSYAIKNEVLAQARLLYISLWVSQERIVSLKEKRSAVQQHLKLSTASTRSDSSLRIHTLKAESDLDLLENEILEAEQNLREQQFAVAEYAGRSPKEYKPIATEPKITVSPEFSDHSTSPQLEVKRLTLEKLGARTSEAKSSWFPDFNLRYREMGGTTMTPRYSEVMVGATLPFAFFWGPNATSKSAQAEQLKAEAEYSREKLKIESRKSLLATRAESLKKQLEQIKRKLLPRAEKRMRLVHNLAPRDMESLQDHREAMEAFPDLKLKALDLRMQYETVVAELSTLTSEALP